MSSPQDHAGRAAHLQRFAPAGRTQAPAVAGPQAGKAELGHRRREIIAAGSGKLEKRGGHDDADRVAADVFSTGVAAASRKNPVLGFIEQTSSRSPRTFRGALGRPPPFPLSSLEHCRLLDRRHARRIPYPPWERRLRFRSYRSSARLPALRKSEVRIPSAPPGGPENSGGFRTSKIIGRYRGLARLAPASRASCFSQFRSDELRAVTSPFWLCKRLAAFKTRLKYETFCFSHISPTLREPERS